MIVYISVYNWGLGIGDWDWGLGIGPNPQSFTIPNPQSPMFMNIDLFYPISSYHSKLKPYKFQLLNFKIL